MSGQVEEQALYDLVEVLEELGPGKLDEAQSRRVEQVLAEAWHLLDVDVQGGMAPYKLEHRTRDLKWDPPHLRFSIVRHGGPNTRQYWTVDLDDRTAAFREKVLADRSPEHREEIKRKVLERLDAGESVSQESLRQRDGPEFPVWSDVFQNEVDPLVLALVDAQRAQMQGGYWFDLETGRVFQDDWPPQDVAAEFGNEHGSLSDSDLEESDRFELLNDGERKEPVQGKEGYVLTLEDMEEIAKAFLRSRGFEPQLWSEEFDR